MTLTIDQRKKIESLESIFLQLKTASSNLTQMRTGEADPRGLGKTKDEMVDLSEQLQRAFSEGKSVFKQALRAYDPKRASYNSQFIQEALIPIKNRILTNKSITHDLATIEDALKPILKLNEAAKSLDQRLAVMIGILSNTKPETLKVMRTQIEQLKQPLFAFMEQSNKSSWTSIFKGNAVREAYQDLSNLADTPSIKVGLRRLMEAIEKETGHHFPVRLHNAGGAPSWTNNEPTSEPPSEPTYVNWPPRPRK